MPARRASFLQALFAQLASEQPRIDAGRWCAHNAFLGAILAGGALVLRLSGPPELLGGPGFALVLAGGAALLLAALVPLVRPGWVPAVLVIDGLVVLGLTIAFAAACIAWARGAAGTRSFRYLPGMVTTAATYGAALCADFGPGRAHARRWRRAGFAVGVGIDALVGGLVIAAVLRA